ncbi:hypothetical protein ACFSX9_00385 [Flavobacterium ardleyense]|uniref:DUF3592 domain-containing protein n=1 Tax=Flavobacterium ardleyense TaxID=2038737 RepID=A0ABW5Z3M9_9FLAO
MIKLKFFVCITVNIVLFTLAIAGYKNIYKNKEIVQKQNPIVVKIVDITYRAKSASTCRVQYKNKDYNDISFSEKAKVGDVNYSDFYYDAENDLVFYKDENIGAFYVVLVMSFFSLLLWFIPKRKFIW